MEVSGHLHALATLPLGRPQSQSGCGDEEEKPLHLPEIEP
jgi:hypothetical protein